MNKPSDKDNVKVTLTDSFGVSAHLRGTTKIDDVVVGYSESRHDGRAAHASLGPDGITHGLTGETSTNETGTLETCGYLVTAMNRAGESWGPPILLTGDADDADAMCKPLDGGRERLRIQVVRAHSDSAFWKEVGTEKSATISATPDDLAEGLRKPIELKARKISPVQRGQLVLALSAIHTPGYVIGNVAKVFQEEQGEWARAIGFKEIWLVGPGVELTHRLA